MPETKDPQAGTSDGSLYPADLVPWDLEPYYSRHVSAMTSEGLHSKAAIAEQLAWRDKRIAELEGRLSLAPEVESGLRDFADEHDYGRADRKSASLWILNFIGGK